MTKPLRTLAVILLFFSTAALAQSQKFESVPGEFLVKLRGKKVSFQSKTTLANILNSYVESTIPESNIVVVRRPVFEAEENSIAELSSVRDVEYVEPNYVYHALEMPNDPLMTSLWGFKNTGQADKDGQVGKPGIDINVEKAWDISTGNNNVVVAVIDTGANYNFQDLKENIWVNQAELNGRPGVDDDNNGVIDDIYGAQFTDSTAAGTATGDPLDDHGHGSHCSGTIGAVGNNGAGVVGINWHVKIMPVKFLNRSGSGSLDNAIRAINYAVKMGAQILSNSWGGGPFSDLLKEAIEKAKDKGVLFIAAAGNDSTNNDSTPTYPASYPLENIVSVAAIDNRGKLATFSNYGKNTVHIAAPGVNILSVSKNTSGQWGYETMSGTSMATPHVSGVAALIKAQNPDMTFRELKERLMYTARPLAGLRGQTISGGVVDAYDALINKKPEIDPEDPFYWQQKPYVVSSDHPYRNGTEQSWDISVPEAHSISLFFQKIKVERGFDEVIIQDGSGNKVQSFTGELDEIYSDAIPGNAAKLILKTDKSITDYGFDLTRISYK